MTLFNNNETVLGLFGNTKNMEKAINNLSEQGLVNDEEKLQIIDEQHLKQQAPDIATAPSVVPQQAHTDTVPVGIEEIIKSGEDNANRVERNSHDMLTDFGLDDAEAKFYARHVARGNSLVILEIDKEQASKATDILEQFDATTLIT
jgi:hypothetical protein